MGNKVEFKEIEEGKLKELITEYCYPKPLFSNYFNNIIVNPYVCVLPDTIVVKSKSGSFNRIYFLSRNEKELEEILKSLGDEDVFNIPSKNGISRELEDLIVRSGYHRAATYQRMIKSKNEDCEEFKGTFAKGSDINVIYDLLYETFNPIFSHLPNKDALKTMIENKQILVNYNLDGIVNGLIMWSIDGKVCNFHAWTSKAPGNESLAIFFEAFNYIEALGVHRSTLWVNVDNLSAKAIYDMMGFVKDGLMDYIFVK